MNVMMMTTSVVGVAGGYMGHAVSRVWGIKRAVQLSIVIWIVTQTCVSLVLVPVDVPGGAPCRSTAHCAAADAVCAPLPANLTAVASASASGNDLVLDLAAAPDLAVPASYNGTCTATVAPPGTPLLVLFGALWGIAAGMTWAQSWALYALLIPGGQEAEFMGYLGFCGRVLTWLPALVYSIVNQASGGRLANFVGSVPIMILGLIVLTCGVDVPDARADVATTLKRRSYGELRAAGPPGSSSPNAKVAPLAAPTET